MLFERSTAVVPIGMPRQKNSDAAPVTLLRWSSSVAYVEPSRLGSRLQRFAHKLFTDRFNANIIKPKPNFVNISHPDGHIKDGRVNGLSAYQRRWVYQIVRDEFPTLKAVGRNDGTFMQVTKLDIIEEARVRHHNILRDSKAFLIPFSSRPKSLSN